MPTIDTIPNKRFSEVTRASDYSLAINSTWDYSTGVSTVIKDKVLFLDVDNTLAVTKDGKRYPSVDNWVFKKDIIEAIRNVKNDFDQFILVTNQGGVNKGYKTPQEVFSYIEAVRKGLQITLGIYCHTHIAFLEEDRKPFLGKFIYDLQKYIKEAHKAKYDGINYEEKYSLFNHIDLENSLMVGDASGLTKYYKEGKFLGYTEDSPDGAVKITDFADSDFSDSDKVFAENMGVKYLDIEQFIITNGQL